MTLGVYDTVHHQNAQGLAYDLWRIRDPNHRVNIKHDTMGATGEHVLVQANTAEELGSFELILYVKDYFERFPNHSEVPDNRFIVPFGMNRLNEDLHLNVQINPTGFTCTLWMQLICHACAQWLISTFLVPLKTIFDLFAVKYM